MPPISKLYITKNEYYMKIGDINVSNFHIVFFNEYYTQWDMLLCLDKKSYYLCIVLIKNG